MSKRISNFHIENAFKNMQDKDIDNNFVVPFPSNYIKNFINHAAMISEKMGEYQFIISNTDSSS